MERYPMKLDPVGKDYLWGGVKLRETYHKKLRLQPLAESWELSCHKDGLSRIANGGLAGLLLIDYLRKDWRGLLGTRGGSFSDFPILFKLIDAARPLSVQVHPDDEYALKTEGEYGKTEMWVVLETEPGATLLYGLNRPLSKEALRSRIEDNTLTDVMRQIRVAAGDVLFVKPGTLHAIGAGIVIAEIQQNSNTTYRVFDYGRLGADGKPRPLHVKKALEVACLEKNEDAVLRAFPSDAGCGGVKNLLAACPYFTVSAMRPGSDAMTVTEDTERFVCLFCADGEGCIKLDGQKTAFQKGETLFLPAGLGEAAVSGDCTLLRITV